MLLNKVALHHLILDYLCITGQYVVCFRISNYFAFRLKFINQYIINTPASEVNLNPWSVVI